MLVAPAIQPGGARTIYLVAITADGSIEEQCNDCAKRPALININE